MKDSSRSCASPALPLSIFYRGSLSSCPYSCAYCPFAKKKDTRTTLQKDAAQLTRFVQWVKEYKPPVRILFTPWGEALVRGYYRNALLELATLPQVESVAIQTNLHVPLSWLKYAAPGKIALWCSFHPSQTTQADFLKRCVTLRTMRIAFSVGMVSMRDQFDAIDAMRQALPPDVYLWLNANNDTGPRYYTAAELQWLTQIDPWFDYSVHQRASAGKPCNAGECSIAVDGEGNITRCQFLHQPLGNLYQDELPGVLRESRCTRRMCDCYIGYAMRKDFPFGAQFGSGILARIPQTNAGIKHLIN